MAPFPQVPYPVDLRLNGARVKRFDVPGGTPEVRQLIIGGPYNATGRGTTASRAKIFTCRPEDARRKKPRCARTILTTLARRAFRRPVGSAPTSSRCSRFTRRGAPRLGRRLRHAAFSGARSAARVARFPVPRRAGSAALHAGQGLSGQRSRARLAAVVLPLEQHSRRSAARPGGARQAERTRGAAAAGAAHARRPAVRRADLEFRRAVAASAQRRDGHARSGHLPVRRSAARRRS